MRELNLRDNRLTDKGLIPIVKVGLNSHQGVIFSCVSFHVSTTTKLVDKCFSEKRSGPPFLLSQKLAPDRCLLAERPTTAVRVETVRVETVKRKPNSRDHPRRGVQPTRVTLRRYRCTLLHQAIKQRHDLYALDLSENKLDRWVRRDPSIGFYPVSPAFARVNLRAAPLEASCSGSSPFLVCPPSPM